MNRAPDETAIDVMLYCAEEGMQRAWNRVLAAPEFTVRSAGGEIEAAAVLAAFSVDVLLLEPGEGSADVDVALVKRLKQYRPDVELVVVVAAARATSTAMAERAAAMGAGAIITTPIVCEPAAALTVKGVAERGRLLRLLHPTHEEWSPEQGAGSYAALKVHTLKSFDQAFVRSVLARTGGNISQAARLAGLDRSNFRRIMKRCRNDMA